MEEFWIEINALSGISLHHLIDVKEIRQRPFPSDQHMPPCVRTVCGRHRIMPDIDIGCGRDIRQRVRGNIRHRLFPSLYRRQQVLLVIRPASAAIQVCPGEQGMRIGWDVIEAVCLDRVTVWGKDSDL